MNLYLEDSRVVVKNELKQDFRIAISVFVNRTQTKREADPRQTSTDTLPEVPPMYDNLLERFRRIQEQLERNKQ